MEESNTGGPLPGAGTFTAGTGAQWAGVALTFGKKGIWTNRCKRIC